MHVDNDKKGVIMFKFCKVLALIALVFVAACSDEEKNQSSAANSENSAISSGDHTARYDATIISRDTGEARHVFQIEIADTQEKIYHGLMGRTSIDANYGLLFDVNIAPRDAQIAFWMKDTLIPLDMLFLDERGIVYYIHTNAQPNDVTPIVPPKRPRAVLEINAGQVEKYGIVLGDLLIADLFERN